MTYSFAINGLGSTRDRSDDVTMVEANSDTGTGSHNSCEPWSNAPIVGFDLKIILKFESFIYLFSENITARCENTIFSPFHF